MQARKAVLPNPFLLATVLFWGLNFVAVKEIYKQMSPAAMSLARFFLMWAALAVVCLVKGESLKYPKEDVGRLLWLGFISMGVYLMLFMEGMHGSAATEGAILLQMAPVFTAILAVLFKQEKFSGGVLVGAFFAFVGSSLVIYGAGAHAGANRLIGNVLVVVSALFWAYSVVLTRPLVMKYSPLRVLTLSMAGGLPVMLLYGFSDVAHTPWHQITPYGWLMFLHIAILSGVAGFLFFYKGVQQIGATGATIYQYLVPPTTAICAILIQHDAPTWMQAVGFLAVLFGVVYASRARYLAAQASAV